MMEYVKTLQDAEKEKYKQLVSIAYMSPCWYRCDPKKFPTYDEVMKSVEAPPTKNQSSRDMFEVVKMLNARFGGN